MYDSRCTFAEFRINLFVHVVLVIAIEWHYHYPNNNLGCPVINQVDQFKLPPHLGYKYPMLGKEGYTEDLPKLSDH